MYLSIPFCTLNSGRYGKGERYGKVSKYLPGRHRILHSQPRLRGLFSTYSARPLRSTLVNECNRDVTTAIAAVDPASCRNESSGSYAGRTESSGVQCQSASELEIEPSDLIIRLKELECQL